MLQIKNIKKTYRTGSLVQKALDDVSLNLRDNEFVAILGPSGSGKTTLLNIIGGLDRYDEGDLIINGVSTKNYKDRDWDSYRNHTVGFVFQSYNLIPHQTLLQNVELALTISGVSKEERRARAIKALEDVGLKEQMNKKPSQLSGGQMQRVSLARALVNNPDILLADEPTGALDSETSRQVMDLLKEVARDRLVVMVTHNPELAEDYANRIVRVRDGKIIEDSNPVSAAEIPAEEAVHRNLGKTSMSFLTALSLSFNNLKTKKARTILTSFAGSIGIIGIALILSLSSGVNDYITSIERDTLSEYPIQIEKTASTMMTTMMSAMKDQKKADGDYVEEVPVLTAMSGGTAVNDLKSFRTFLQSGKSGIDPYVQAIDYKYGIIPQIYRVDPDETVRICPDPVMQSMFGDSGMISQFLSSSAMSEQFSVLPEDEDLYQDQYELKAGHWPENKNECVVVLSSEGQLPDLTIYMLGLRPQKDLDEIVKKMQNDKAEEIKVEPKNWDYDDILGRTFKVVSSSDYYQYDSKFKIWTDRSEDGEYLEKIVKNGQDLKVTGIVQPAPAETVTMLSDGIYYREDLLDELMKEAADSEVVKAQLKTPDINVLTGEKFGEKSKDSPFSTEDLFTVDEDAFSKAFEIDPSKIDPSASLSGLDLSFGGMDIGSLMDMDALSASVPQLSADSLGQILNGALKPATSETMTSIFQNLLNGYEDYSKDNPDISLDGMSQGIEQYLNSDEVKNYLQQQISGILQEAGGQIFNEQDIENLLRSILQGYTDFAAGQPDPDDFDANFEAYMNSGAVQQQISQYVAKVQQDLSNVNISSAQIEEMVSHIASGYDSYASANNLATTASVMNGFMNYLQTSDGQNRLNSAVSEIVDTDRLQSNISDLMNSTMSSASGAVSQQISSVMAQMMNQISSALSVSLTSGMNSLMENMSSAFSIDSDALAGAFRMNMDDKEFADLMKSMMMAEENSLENNLKKFGYADEEDPSAIYIYPKSFESKDEIDRIITEYSDREEAAGHPDRRITYTDMVGTMMSGVTDIINTVSYVLIAFVGVSLIVSSIMIGVITYISVLERKKEIGILRSIGASKQNISEVFNAETFITGLLSGLFGVGITLILLIPINMIIHSLTGSSAVNAFLPWQAGVLLILLSIGLTMLGGLIPSRKASQQDPVEALRTE